MEDYLFDLALCTEFASLNRRRMAEEIVRFLKVFRSSSFETVHNYLGKDNILRKGAISAHEGERVIIPMNMRDGCLIAVGKENEDWNFSAPHGAGRICKRSEAKELFTVEEFKEAMEGVYSSTVNASTLDESPHGVQADGGDRPPHLPHRDRRERRQACLQLQGGKRRPPVRLISDNKKEMGFAHLF